MKTIRTLVIGLTLGLGLGLWFGINIGKDRPLLSNPLAEDSLQQALKRAGEKSGDALEKGGKALKDTLRD